MNQVSEVSDMGEVPDELERVLVNWAYFLEHIEGRLSPGMQEQIVKTVGLLEELKNIRARLTVK